MSNFDLWWLILKRYLRLIWVCGIFALLFAVILFAGFVKNDMLSGLYRDIMKDAGMEYVTMKCGYLPDTDAGNAEFGIYYSKSGETYDITVSCDSAELSVDRYGRGLNICVILPIWQQYISDESLKYGDFIWLYRAYATQSGISVGDMVTLSGNTTKSYRVAGTYTSELVSYLQTGFTPSFLIVRDVGEESASLVCAVDQIYPLFKSQLGRSITDDYRLMDLCEGYYLTEIGLNALFCMFAVGAALLQIKMIAMMNNNLTRQSFLLSAFGMSKVKQWCFNMSILSIFGLISLMLSVGIFYVFVSVTEMLSKNIMGMVFGEVFIGLSILFVMLGYIVIAAVTQIFCVKINNGGSEL